MGEHDESIGQAVHAAHLAWALEQKSKGTLGQLAGGFVPRTWEALHPDQRMGYVRQGRAALEAAAWRYEDGYQAGRAAERDATLAAEAERDLARARLTSALDGMARERAQHQRLPHRVAAWVLEQHDGVCQAIGLALPLGRG